MFSIKKVLLFSIILFNVNNSFSLFGPFLEPDDLLELEQIINQENFVQDLRTTLFNSFLYPYGKVKSLLGDMKNKFITTKTKVFSLPGFFVNRQIDIVKPKAKLLLEELGDSAGEQLGVITPKAKLFIDELGNSAGEQLDVIRPKAKLFIEELGDSAGEQLDGIRPKAKDAINDLGYAFRKQLLKIGLQSIGLASFGLSVLYGFKIMLHELKNSLNASKYPNIIIDSSNLGYLDKFKTLIYGEKFIPNKMVFSPQLTQKVYNIINFTGLVNKKISVGNTDIKYKKLLLSGPSGNGKAMFAKNLALTSGMGFIALSGSSLSLLPELDAINAITDIFNRTDKFSKGLVIFIEKIDYLLPRPSLYSNSNKYKLSLLSHFIDIIKTKTNKSMLILSTNQSTLLNPEVINLVDELIDFSLPGHSERIKLLNLYIDDLLLTNKNLSPEYKASIKTVLNTTEIEKIATATENLSCSAIKNIISNINEECEISELPTFEKSIIDHVLINIQDKNNLIALSL